MITETTKMMPVLEPVHDTEVISLIMASQADEQPVVESQLCLIEQEVRSVAVRDNYIETSESIQDQPVRPTTSRIRWDYAIFFSTLHVLALLAFLPYFFSWAGVAAFVIGTIVFGQMAIPIGYHRLLSHRSFRTPKWFERTLVTLAMCSAQETPAHWVAWHRMHHSHSDHRDDPHSPRLGVLGACELADVRKSNSLGDFFDVREVRERHSFGPVLSLDRETSDPCGHFLSWSRGAVCYRCKYCLRHRYRK